MPCSRHGRQCSTLWPTPRDCVARSVVACSHVCRHSMQSCATLLPFVGRAAATKCMCKAAPPPLHAYPQCFREACAPSPACVCCMLWLCTMSQGDAPGCKGAYAVLSGRLSDVRGFNDFLQDFLVMVRAERGTGKLASLCRRLLTSPAEVAGDWCACVH